MSIISDEEPLGARKRESLDAPTPEGGEVENPWKETQPAHDALQPSGTAYVSDAELKERLPSTAAQSSSTATEPLPRASEDVLREFDPLADTKEAESRLAWEISEGHPMPPPKEEGTNDMNEPGPVPQSTSSSEPPAVPSKSATSTGIAFPSLASLAKSLTLSRARPRSLDATPRDVKDAHAAALALSRSQPITPDVSTTARAPDRTSGASGEAGDSERQEPDEPPPFDFQKFLDQMKVKGAEPVAKYLRS